MKVAITSVTLLLCVAIAVAKPAQDIPKCLKEAWPDFATVDQPCFKTISDLDIVPEEVCYIDTTDPLYDYTLCYPPRKMLSI